MATIETSPNNVNMLHRKTLAFKWQLQLLANGNPIDLSSILFTLIIIDRRGDIIKTAQNGNGLSISNDTFNLIFDIPVADLDNLDNAHKYILVREQGIDKIPIIQGDFNVVDTFHNPTPKTNIIGNSTLIQTSILSGQTIQITGCQLIGGGGGGSSSSWGSITGNIASQLDLQNSLNAKENISNKANDLNSPNNTKYPTTLAVATGLSNKYDNSNPANYQTFLQVQTEIANSLVPYSTVTYADAREAAAKAYADQLVVGLLDDRGNYDASGNTFPTTGGSGPSGAIKKGDLWTVSVSGMLAGLKVTPGDLVRAIVDNPGQTNSNWAVSETNIGYTAEDQSNKSTSISVDQGSNQKYPTVKSVFDWATSVFSTASSVATQIAAALVGYATQTWVNAQGFLVANTPITGATKTKVTYDSTGRVTGGADATTADIADSTNKRYVTDAQLTAIGTISGKAPNNLAGTPTEIQFAVSDETTALTAGVNKIKFRMPYAMTLTSVRASVNTAQTSGSILTIDVNENGPSILGTKLTIDNGETTSTTAATPHTINDPNLLDDAEISIDIDQVGTGATGLKITLKGTRV